MRAARLAGPALLAWLCMTGAARAQSCTASSTALAFGSYMTTQSSATTANATISVTCQATVAVLATITTSVSPGSSGNAASRTLTNGSNSLAYNVYTNPTYSQVWGDGTGGTSPVTASVLLSVGSATTTATAYGQITALQNVAPGPYTDTLIVTVAW